MSTNNAVNSGLSGTTGTGNFVGSTSPSLTTPKVITGINDTNGNQLIGVTATGSAVNNVQLVNAATANNPSLSATGSDSNISLLLKGKGTGGAAILGTSTNDNAAAGYVGEIISSTIASGSALSVTTVTPLDLTSISLTAGDWDVFGMVVFAANSVVMTVNRAWISTTSATLPDNSIISQINSAGTSAFAAPTYARISISSTTTVYLSAEAIFATGSVTICGNIYARRSR